LLVDGTSECGGIIPTSKGAGTIHYSGFNNDSHNCVWVLEPPPDVVRFCNYNIKVDGIVFLLP